MTSLLPDESTYTTLARALVSLEHSNVIRYLPSFECCGSCAQWRFANEDWGDSLGLVHFNEQTRDRADEICELFLTVQSLDEGRLSHDVLMDQVEAALLNGGFDKLADPRPEGLLLHQADAKFDTFYRNDYGFEVVGLFGEDDELRPS